MPKKMLPPNHPDRPEWNMFRRVLDREDVYRPGLSEEAAGALLKSLFEEAWVEKPEEVLALCDGKRLKSRAVEMSRQPGMFNQYIEFLKERLWVNTPDGEVPVAQDAERGSSGMAIKYWRPQNGGVAEYMKHRITWLNSDWSKEQAVKGHQVSTEMLAANGTELADGGEFVRAAKILGSDDADASEVALEGRNLREERERLVAGARREDSLNGSDPDQEPEKSGPTDEAQIVADARRRRLESFIRTPITPDLLSSPNRPEYAFFGATLGRVIEAAPAPGDRVIQLRALAEETLRSACKEMPDYDAAIEDLSEWDPSKKSFFAYYPDATDFLVEKNEVPKLSPKPVNKEAELAATLMGIGPSAPENNSESLDAPTGLFDQVSFASQTLRVSSMWNARATPDALDDPERPDYLFLCEAMKVEPSSSITPAEMHARIKQMASDWVIYCSKPENAKITVKLFERIRGWNPSKDGFFGEVLMEELSEIARAKVVEVEQAPIPEDAALSDLDNLRTHNPNLDESDITALLARKAAKLAVSTDQQLSMFGDAPQGGSPSL